MKNPIKLISTWNRAKYYAKYRFGLVLKLIFFLIFHKTFEINLIGFFIDKMLRKNVFKNEIRVN